MTSWRTLYAVLAVLAALTGAVLLASRQWWSAGACAVCAVAFGLEAAGVETMGRTRRVLARRRGRGGH